MTLCLPTGNGFAYLWSIPGTRERERGCHGFPSLVVCDPTGRLTQKIEDVGRSINSNHWDARSNCRANPQTHFKCCIRKKSEQTSGKSPSTSRPLPFSRNICFVCFRCFRVSPGSSSWTSGMGPDHLDRAGPCECSDWITVPDVSASIRFCSAICSWSHGTSSGLETEQKSKGDCNVTTLTRITEVTHRHTLYP
jgi:hypothetical protein